jgi:hypothetical protein
MLYRQGGSEGGGSQCAVAEVTTEVSVSERLASFQSSWTDFSNIHAGV